MDAVDSTSIAVFSVADIWARMPLASAALSMWRFVFDEKRLGSLWDRFRGRCYEDVITFPNMTHLVADAIVLYRGSGRRSFEKNIESGQLETTVSAAFGKLGRLPLEVSQGLLREGTASLRQLFPEECLQEASSELSDMQVIVLDGKAIKNVHKLLKPLRGKGGGMLGGRAVVALDWSTGLAMAMQTHCDGDAGEKTLVEGLIPQVHESTSKPCLFVADRGFCDLVQTARFTKRSGDHFLVRYQGSTKFVPDASRPETQGKDVHGRSYVQSYGWLGVEKNPARRYVRRIVLPLAKEPLILVTDLLDDEKYSAQSLLSLYHGRWEIERMFQKVTEVFGLEQLIGTKPKACIFQLGFCLLLYNIVRVLTNYVSKAQGMPLNELSQEKLFDDVQDQLVAWTVLFTPEQTMASFRDCPAAEELKNRLDAVLSEAWSDTWKKSKPQPNRPMPVRQGMRGHGSVFRIMQEYAATKAKEKAKADAPEQAREKDMTQRC